jgi:hypothetical protein
MKRKLPAMLFIALIALLFAVVSVGYARLAGYSLPWWTNDGGGGASTSEKYSLNATIGQADAKTLSGGNYRLEGGFWGGMGAAVVFQRVYLPLTAKP